MSAWKDQFVASRMKASAAYKAWKAAYGRQTLLKPAVTAGYEFCDFCDFCRKTPVTSWQDAKVAPSIHDGQMNVLGHRMTSGFVTCVGAKEKLRLVLGEEHEIHTCPLRASRLVAARC